MSKHDARQSNRKNDAASTSDTSTMFVYNRPIGEIMTALEKKTGQDFGWQELSFVNVKKGTAVEARQRQLFLDLARRWTDWWKENWSKYVATEADAQLDRIEKTLQKEADAINALKKIDNTNIPLGPKVKIPDGTEVQWIDSFKAWPSQGFLDFDTDRHPKPPQAMLEKASEDSPGEELLAWAEKEQVDLVTLVQKTPDGKKSYFAFLPIGMKVWRLDNARYDSLEKELQTSEKFDFPKPWERPLAQIDETSGVYDNQATVSFLFQTKEGTWGVLQLAPPFPTPENPQLSTYTLGGMKYKLIVRED